MKPKFTSKNDKKPTDSSVKKGWINKQRVLVFCQRGINFRARHLMLDLRSLLPHSRADNKLDRKDKLIIINEVAEMKNCNHCLFFEMRRRTDLFMWMSSIPHGPSVKFVVENVHTMDELKLTGNCLKGSRPLLSFDSTFDASPHYKLLKEMFTQTFGTPHRHPKIKPFCDRVMNFAILDNRIWIRNFQIVNQSDMSLAEVGPRFVLNVIRIFNGSFGGSTLYENPHYVSPHQHRRDLKKKASLRYRQKVQERKDYVTRMEELTAPVTNEIDDVFHTVTQADLQEAK